MKLEQYITEKASKNVIVVDIQPMYSNYQGFKTWEFTEFLNSQAKDILYFYNGPDTVGSDSERDIRYWLMENELEESVLNRITFVDKGYGFFRCLMDEGVDNNIIIKMIRYMFKKKKYDSRDIDEMEWRKELGEDYDDVEYLITGGDMIYVPDIDIRTLRKFSGAYIMGGGRNECFNEVKLLMSAFNVRATEVKRFIY